MFIRSLRRSWPLLILMTILFLYFTQYVLTGPLIVPPKHIGYLDRTELVIAVLMLPVFSFLLPNKFEIELSLSCGTSTVKLFFTKAFVYLIYTVIPVLVFIWLYKYVPYKGSERPKIGIFIPENYKLYMVVSVLVTMFFFFALFCFLRVLLRNCYAPILVGLAIYSLAYNTCKNIQNGVDIERCLTDPFISVYIMGDTVPNNIATQHPELGVVANAWTYNRLIFVALGIVLLAVTYFMLRREKLHRGFGD